MCEPQPTRSRPSSRLLHGAVHGEAVERVPIRLPGHKGGHWADHDWRNWRKRVYAPAAADVKLEASRPYDLRHTFCSLLIAEGLSVVEIAQQAGHSPTMTLATYAHVIEDLAGTERRPAETVIRNAREKLASELLPSKAQKRRR